MTTEVNPFRTQLLKWVGNKQRYAHEICTYLPETWDRYVEPFLGSGAVLGTLAPSHGIGSDACAPLIGVFQELRRDPESLKAWYAERWRLIESIGKEDAYRQVLASFNAAPNSADFVFLTRSCYGGVVRFRKDDGYMSTPCGAHQPISPQSFGQRVDIWHERTLGTSFIHADFEETMSEAGYGDIVYCDPPYSDTQTILYGAQSFHLDRLLRVIAEAKERGAKVLLSLDHSKASGRRKVDFDLPDGLFETQVTVNCGVSQLRRFQRSGETLTDELVADRLLLTY